MEKFETELQGDPEHALSLGYSGDIELRKGRRAEAFALLRRAEGLNGELHVVHQDLGIYYQEGHEIELAVKEFQEGARTAPGNYDAHYGLARIYRQAGRVQEADREFGVVQRLHEEKREVPLTRLGGPGSLGGKC